MFQVIQKKFFILLFVLSSLALSVPRYDAHFVPEHESIWFYLEDDVHFIGQTFTAIQSGRIGYLSISVASSYYLTDPDQPLLHVSIYATEDGVPIGEPLSTYIHTHSQLSYIKAITFPDNVYVTAGTQYALVMSYPDYDYENESGFPGKVEGYNKFMSIERIEYEDGDLLRSADGTDWVIWPGNDLLFEIIMDALTPDVTSYQFDGMHGYDFITACFTDVKYFNFIEYLSGFSPAHFETSSPGGWQDLALMTTPLFTVDRFQGDIVVEFDVSYITDYEKSWRENNKLYVQFLNLGYGPAYEFTIKPNRAQDRYTSEDFKLKRFDFYDPNTSYTVAKGWSHVLTPHGPDCVRTKYKIVFSQNGPIDAYVDVQDGNGWVHALSTYDDSYDDFTNIKFRYKTGTVADNSNYKIWIDDIRVNQMD